jgi:hypothetical protein
MFLISLPSTFQVGDSADVRINGKPARVTWRDRKTLVIEPNDRRPVLAVKSSGGEMHILCGGPRLPGVDRTMVVQNLWVGMPDAELVGLIREAKRCRDQGAPTVTCSISGYDEDSRELGDIPEVRTLCKRLVDCGYVAFLDAATSIRGLPTFCACMSLGAWEVWRMARNEMGPSGRQSVPTAVLDDFLNRELPRLKGVAEKYLAGAEEAAVKAGGPVAETHAQLRQIVEDAEPLLRQLWARHKSDDDILVLADMRRSECRQFARSWWPDGRVRAAQKSGTFLPYLQPVELIEVILAGSSEAQRQAARELRGFARAGFVPLWVVARTGHWATCWAPPGSGMAVVRSEPGPKPEPKPEDN